MVGGEEGRGRSRYLGVGERGEGNADKEGRSCKEEIAEERGEEETVERGRGGGEEGAGWAGYP